jgi:hypothetical protein
MVIHLLFLRLKVKESHIELVVGIPCQVTTGRISSTSSSSNSNCCSITGRCCDSGTVIGVVMRVEPQQKLLL